VGGGGWGCGVETRMLVGNHRMKTLKKTTMGEDETSAWYA